MSSWGTSKSKTGRRVEVDKETLLLEEPRFDAPILGRPAPGIRYSVIDMQLQCSQIADLTWKLARIKVTSTIQPEGLVCRPKRTPQSSKFRFSVFHRPRWWSHFPNSR